MRVHFREVQACAMKDVANYDMICDILLGDNVDYHSKTWIWNGNDSHDIVTIHEFSAFCFYDPPSVLLACDALSFQT